MIRKMLVAGVLVGTPIFVLAGPASAHTAEAVFSTQCGDPGYWVISAPKLTTHDDGGQPYTASVRPATTVYPLDTPSVTVTWMVKWQDGATDGGSETIDRPAHCPPVGTVPPPSTVPPATTVPVPTPTTVPAETTTLPAPIVPAPPAPPTPSQVQQEPPKAASSHAVTPSVSLPATGSSTAVVAIAGGGGALLLVLGAILLVFAMGWRQNRRQARRREWPSIKLEHADRPVGYHRIRQNRSEES